MSFSALAAEPIRAGQITRRRQKTRALINLGAVLYHPICHARHLHKQTLAKGSQQIVHMRRGGWRDNMFYQTVARSLAQGVGQHLLRHIGNIAAQFRKSARKHGKRGHHKN
jgi:hypothetical protein